MASTTSTAPGTPVPYDLGMGYDQLNQLASTRSYYNPVTVTLDRFYRYDALGRRYAKLNSTAANSAGTIYATNPEFRNLSVLDNNLNTTWNVVWGRGFNEALLVDGWGQYYYQHGDQIRSTIGVSKADGTIQSFVHYWPYGDYDQVIVQNDLGGYVAAATLYSGELYDQETRLSYYGYRYYNPGNGRWINRDPIGEAGGVNLYEMVGGGVMSGADYLGMWKRTDEWKGGSRGPYSGHVCKDRESDTYYTLSISITGNDDSHLLKMDENGNVDIAPLLKAMENRNRRKVLESIKQFNGTFVNPDNYAKWSPTIQRQNLSDWFGDVKGVRVTDCVGAQHAIAHHGLMSSISEKNYTILSSIGKNGASDFFENLNSPISELKQGDLGYILNRSDYLNQMLRKGLHNTGHAVFKGEAVIHITNGKFWGFGLGTNADFFTEDEIMDKMKAHNKKYFGNPKLELGQTAGGWDPKSAMFWNHSKIGMATFDALNK